MNVDTKELANHARKVMNDIIYLALATASKEGQPWNSPVYCAFDTNYTFYFASWKQNQHSKNIQENKKVFAVIYDSTVPESTGFGVYMQGKAVMLGEGNLEQIQRALECLYSRKNKKPREAKEFLGNYPRRIFAFYPEKIWVNGEGDVGGNFVDTRVEITKEFLKTRLL